MRERRTTARLDVALRVQYCPTERPVIRDGRVRNICETGIGLLARAPQPVGDRISATVPLDGPDCALSAVGVVRWSQDRPRRGGWYPLGLEWLPFDESSRARLEAFLDERARERSQGGGGPWWKAARIRRAMATTPGVVSIVGTALIVCGLMPLVHENRMLVKARDGLLAEWTATTAEMGRLSDAERRLQIQLTIAQSRLSDTASQFKKLTAAQEQLEGRLQRVSQEFDELREADEQLRAQRIRLIQQVLDLEQQRLILTRQVSTIPQARRAWHRGALPATGLGRGPAGRLPHEARTPIRVRVYAPETTSP